MTQKGIHTWDLVLKYHECPQCGNIIESRQDYYLEGKKYVKQLVCPRCQNEFRVTKPIRQI